MISTKGRYAVRTMVDLARQDKERFVPLSEIAERQKISKLYLEIILKKLVAAKLLVGKSGKSGGYKLTRPPEKYTVREILELTEGTIAPVACLKKGAKACPMKKVCPTIGMWEEYRDLISDFFIKKTLKDLI